MQNNARVIEWPCQALSVGQEIGDYVITEVIGQDGFEITYLATSRSLGQRVLIREFFPFGSVSRATDRNISPTSESARRVLENGLTNFHAQAEILATIDHPSIERIVDCLSAYGTSYMVSRWEEGEKLSALLAHPPTLDEQGILDLLIPLIEGLARVHAAGLVHGDIRPSRILMRPDGKPVLVGFARARWQLAQVPGCPIVLQPSNYAPVERFSPLGETTLRPTRDIYALAATLYQAVTGLVPPDAIARGGVLLGQPDPLRPAAEVARDKFSPHLLSAIDHALALDERGRPQDLVAWRAMIRGEIALSLISNQHKSQSTVGDKEPGLYGNAGRRAISTVLLVSTVAALGVAGFYLFPGLIKYGVTVGTKPESSKPGGATADSIGAGRTPLEELKEPASPLPTTAAPLLPPPSPAIPERSTSAQDEIPVPQPASPASPVPTGEPRTGLPLAQSAAGASQPAPIANPHAEEIAHLLAAARNDLSALRLSKPAGNNAFERYLEVFTLDPSHGEAVKGMKDLVQRYEKLADRAVREGNNKKALLSIDQALAVLESDQLNSLLSPTLRRVFENDIERLRNTRTSLSRRLKGRP